jgi:serine/threonine protein kinase
MALATNLKSNDINKMQNNSTPVSRQHLYGSLENFHIEKQIGQGQFSQVFKAKCLIDHRVVALKRMKVNKKCKIFIK